jgi:hypothetical protein
LQLQILANPVKTVRKRRSTFRLPVKWRAKGGTPRKKHVHEQPFVFNAPKESKSGLVALVLFSTKHGLIGILSTAEAKACVSFFKGQTAAGCHL